MASNLITKFATVFVVLILTLCVCAPIVASMATTTETVTVETEYGANSIDSAVYGTISSYKVSLGLDYDIARVDATYPYAVNPDGTWVRYSAHTLTNMAVYLNDKSSFRTTSDLSTYDTVTLGTDITTYPATKTVNGWTFTLTRNAENNQIIEVNTTATSDGNAAYILVPYDVTYSVPTILTYGNNSIHDLILSDSIGTMSGTTFTPSAGGDYLSIPVRILTDNQSTYYVKNGATYYAPDTNGDLAAFVAPSTTGVNSALTLTFTSSQTYTDVYELTGSSTDGDLANVIIPVNVYQTVTVTPIPKQVLTYNGSSFIVDTTGNLWATGNNSQGQFGNGNTNTLNDWTIIKTNVDKVAVCVGSDNNTTYAIDTTGNLWAAGYAGSSNYRYFFVEPIVNGWTQITSGVTVTHAGGNFGSSAYIDSNGTLHGTYQYRSDITSIQNVSKVSYGNTLYYLSGTTLYGANNWSAPFEVAANVVNFASNGQSTYYIDSDNDLYVFGQNTAGQLGTGDHVTVDRASPVKVASNVSKVGVTEYDSASPSSVFAYYINNSNELYMTGANAQYQLGLGNNTAPDVWTKSSENVADAWLGFNYSVYKKTSGELYGVGQNVQRQLGIGVTSNYVTSWTSLNINNAVDVSLKDRGGYPCSLVATPNSALVAGSSFNSQIPQQYTTWQVVSSSTSTVLVANTVETETISDLRGTVSNNVFTPSAAGDYLYVPIIDFDTYTYYVSNGSTVYAPDLAGNALAPHVVPDTTGIYADLTINLTQLTGYNDQIYSVTGSSTDTDEVGIAIPYTVTYNGYTDAHYAYNGLGDGTTSYYYWTDANGDYLYVPGDVLNGYPVLVDAGDYVYGIPSDSDKIVAMTDVSDIAGLVASRDTLIDPNEINGSGSGFIIVPVAYSGGANAPHTALKHVYAVRGNVANNIFTEDANGTYLSIPIPVLVEHTYHIGKGKVYYPVNMNDAHFSQTAPLTNMVNASLHLTFTADSEIPTLYELSATSSDLSLGAVWIPYVATYETTETTTHELIPMASVIIMVVILLAIVAAVGGIMRVKGGHF